jgi:outer membrane protein
MLTWYLRPSVGASILAAALPVAAYAVEPGWSLPPVPGEWTVTVGVEGTVAPAFEGSSQYLFSPMPVFFLRPVGHAARFRSERDGASIALLNLGSFAAGPAAKFKSARYESDSGQLRGLGDVDWALEIGGFAEYWPSEWLRTRIEVRRGFNGHDGIVADLTADVVVPLLERWTVSGGPRVTFADGKATAPYFSINAAQARASGLPEFDAKGGLHSIGVGAQVRYQWTPQWSSRLFVEYERLAGDAASSPLVAQRGSPDQVTVGAGVTYSFNVKLW